MLTAFRPCLRQHAAVPRSGTADAVAAAGMFRAGGGVRERRLSMGMPVWRGVSTAYVRRCDAGTPVWSVRAGATGASGILAAGGGCAARRGLRATSRRVGAAPLAHTSHSQHRHRTTTPWCGATHHITRP